MTTPNNTVAGLPPRKNERDFDGKFRTIYLFDSPLEQGRFQRSVEAALASVDAGGEGLPVMRTAFVTSQSSGSDDTYRLVFDFRSLAALQQAHKEWTTFANRRLATAEQPGSAVQGNAVAYRWWNGSAWEYDNRPQPGSDAQPLYTTPPPAPAAEQGDALAEQYRKGWEAGHATAHRIRNALAAPSGVRVDDAMVERAMRAFMETHRPELEHSIRAALTAALAGKEGA